MDTLTGLLDEWWPVQPHGNRHKYHCYLDMIEQDNAYDIYNGVVCRCGLDMYIQMHGGPTVNERRRNEEEFRRPRIR